MSTFEIAGISLSTREVALCTVIVVLLAIIFQQSRSKPTRINTKIGLDKEKVVDFRKLSEIEDLDKIALCRCWKSSKFPLCDGAHNEHNKCCGDNVGPVIIENDLKKPDEDKSK
eukprot:INCI5777.1.p2 GENE.INCI5777.1~~INCI5777.1.p2  ORF type:complete len:114 (-),score=27.11 INCI5777.1:132-473(-)